MTAITAPSCAGPREPISRRAFVAGASAVAGTVAVAAVIRSPARSEERDRPAGGSATAPAALPALGAFVAAIGTTFVMEGGLRPRRLVLDQAVARAAGSAPDAAKTTGEHFSLLFRGAAGRVQPGATRTLSHPELGSIELFVSPVGRGVRAQDYEAIIDQRRIIGR
ncbi:MAG: hypothetical protein JWM89_1905 [Acidimicrobiales bacterium]|nr:hypothetical protein [Acidimicrobiales bacterium]